MKLKIAVSGILLCLCLTITPVSALSLNEILPSTKRSLSHESDHNLDLPKNYLIQDAISLSPETFVLVGSSIEDNTARSFGWVRLYSDFVLRIEHILTGTVTKNTNVYNLIETSFVSVQASTSQIFLLGNVYYQDQLTDEHHNSSIQMILDISLDEFNTNQITYYPNFRAISSQLLRIQEYSELTLRVEEIGYLYYIVQDNLVSTSGLPTTISLFIDQINQQRILVGPYYLEDILGEESIGFAPFGTQLIYFQLNEYGQLKATGFIENAEIPGPYILIEESLTLSSIKVASLDYSIVIAQYGTKEGEPYFSIAAISPSLDTLNWMYELPAIPASRFEVVSNDNAAYLSYSSLANNQFNLNVIMVLEDGSIPSHIEMTNFYATNSIISEKKLIIFAYHNNEVYALVFEDELQYMVDQLLDAFKNIFLGGSPLGILILLSLFALSLNEVKNRYKKRVSDKLYPDKTD